MTKIKDPVRSASLFTHHGLMDPRFASKKDFHAKPERPLLSLLFYWFARLKES
jgi:hypothetical protein